MCIKLYFFLDIYNFMCIKEFNETRKRRNENEYPNFKNKIFQQ